MSLRFPGTRTPGAAPALAFGLALVLTGCGANFEAETYQTRAVADGTTTGVGEVAVLNITVVPPEGSDTLEAGDDAEVRLTLTNDGDEDDRLVEVTTPAAAAVELQEEGGQVDAVVVPRRGSTGDTVTLALTRLTEDLRPGRYIEMTLRFERAGELAVRVPIATTGEYDAERERSEHFHPIGEEHDEGEPRGEGGGRESGEVGGSGSDH